MKIIIVGKGGSGKDFLKSKFIERGFTKSISCTTRPRRTNEIADVDYNFIPKANFELMIQKDMFQEWDIFNGWYYGTTRKVWDESQIFIKTPRGVEKISKEDRVNCFIIYLDIGINIRTKRLSERQDADDVVRRVNADAIDFENFTDYDLRITNPDF